jgi:hypothetical protein
MDLPQQINATDVCNYPHTSIERDTGPYTHEMVPVRGERLQAIALLRRFKLAWRVFTGKADVLTWDA